MIMFQNQLKSDEMSSLCDVLKIDLHLFVIFGLKTSRNEIKNNLNCYNVHKISVI